MRSLSLVHHILLKDIYTSRSSNLCFFDVDRDKDNELILGFWDSGPLLENGEADVEHNFGSLYVIKHGQVWKAYRELGVVLCVTAGYIVSDDQPWILALCADSNCHAFSALDRCDEERCDPKVPFCPSSETRLRSKEKPQNLNVVHSQQLAYNASDICVLHSENVCELAVAHSDRIVRLYAWCPTECRSAGEYGIHSHGRFVVLIKWELAGQIDRIGAHLTITGELMLIASQPGGGFAVLQRNFVKHNDQIVPTLMYHPPRVVSTCNLDARTWIVGNIRSNLDTATKRTYHPQERAMCSPPSESRTLPTGPVRTIMAIGMADGTVMLIDPSATNRTEQVLWCAQLHLRGELFGLSKLSLTRSGTDEVCACAWDGTTYVFNDRKQILRFPMGRSCQAFAAGWYAVEPGRNEPVFAYSTCENSLLIYYKLDIDRLAEPDLLDELGSYECVVSMLQSLNIDPRNRVQLREVVHRLLYQSCDLDKFALSKIANGYQNT